MKLINWSSKLWNIIKQWHETWTPKPHGLFRLGIELQSLQTETLLSMVRAFAGLDILHERDFSVRWQLGNENELFRDEKIPVPRLFRSKKWFLHKTVMKRGIEFFIGLIMVFWDGAKKIFLDTESSTSFGEMIDCISCIGSEWHWVLPWQPLLLSNT